MADARDVLVTGIGLVSSLGEGLDAHWAALNRPGGFEPVVDTQRLAPFPVHPMVPLAFDTQILKRGDQRQMEPWQRFGTYAAGLALDQAGIKGDASLLGRMDMIVAAGGGERDCAVDAAILSALPQAPNAEVLLNQRLTADLRPTLFLAQLSNLLAGNISVVHGVVGSSRTFMGEELAGADAVRIANARIRAGQGELILVGGAYNPERADCLLQYAMAHMLHKGGFAGVWQRQSTGGGLILGAVGCFLVLESRAHAEARGAVPLARIGGVATDRCRREPGQATANAERQLAQLGGGADAVISGATGAAAATEEERRFLDQLGLPTRASATALGHSMEPSFSASLALAVVALGRGQLFAPLEAAEKSTETALRRILVTSWGHWRGESMALVESA